MFAQSKTLPDSKIRRWLKTMLPLWSGEGIVTDATALELHRRYELDSIQTGHRLGPIIAAVSLIGAIMLGMGAILFFAANWKEVTPTQKVMLIFAGILITYVAGFEFRAGRWKLPILGDALILVGSLFYGAAIWLIAQIFNIQEHYPNGVLLWGLGILPLAAVIPSMGVFADRPAGPAGLNAGHAGLPIGKNIIVTALASLLFLLYFALECYTVMSPNFLYLGLALAMFWPAYRVKSRLLIFINYVGFAAWFPVTYAVVAPGPLPVGPMLCLGILAGLSAYFLGRMHAASDPDRYLAPVYLLIGSFAVMAPLYSMTFGSLVKWMPVGKMPVGSAAIFWSGMAVFAVISALAVLATIRIEKGRGGRLPYPILIEAVTALAVAAIAFILLTFKPFITATLFLDDSLIAVIFNIVLALVLIGMITVGYVQEMNILSGLGMLGVVVLLATRYFDMFWKLMSRSQFFIIGGVLLLILAWILERTRRGITAATKEAIHG